MKRRKKSGMGGVIFGPILILLSIADLKMRLDTTTTGRRRVHPGHRCWNGDVGPKDLVYRANGQDDGDFRQLSGIVRGLFGRESERRNLRMGERRGR